MKFIDKVKELSGGQIVFEYVGGPEVVPANDLYSWVKNGSLDGAWMWGNLTRGDVPGAGAAMSASNQTWDESRAKAMPVLNAEFNKKGVYLLGSLQASRSAYNMIGFRNKQIAKVDDLKNMKVGRGGVTVDFLKAAGAVNVVLQRPETYTALQQGTVDACISTPSTFNDLTLTEVIKFGLTQYFSGSGDISIINLEKWNKLSKAQQDIILKAEAETEAWGTENFDKLMGDHVTKMEKAGVKMFSLPADEAKKFYDTLYKAEWDAVIRDAPEAGPKLKEVLYNPNQPLRSPDPNKPGWWK
jgi:TRAP-type C4-dicarboxylate transport system substrate-binding protein